MFVDSHFCAKKVIDDRSQPLLLQMIMIVVGVVAWELALLGPAQIESFLLRFDSCIHALLVIVWRFGSRVVVVWFLLARTFNSLLIEESRIIAFLEKVHHVAQSIFLDRAHESSWVRTVSASVLLFDEFRHVNAFA